MHGTNRSKQTGRVEGGLIRSSQRATTLICLSWLILVATNTPVWAAESLTLSSSTSLSNEGYFVLDWPASPTARSLALQQSEDREFTNPLTRALDAVDAATITGLQDGTYFFRLTENDSVVSNTVSVTVQHHSLGRAGGFFLLGLVLFTVLVISILSGNRRAGI